MREGGFQANTIDSELKGIEDGRTAWNKKTVVVVDEAAMVSTENLAKLAAAARSSGAKLIIAGDDAQLGSIERGGMFETLRQRQGAAILTEVQRVKDVEEQALWGKMHKGEFRDMLAKHDKAGRIHWSAKQTDALRDMAQRYTADSAAAPEKNRFMFAFTNAEVGALNTHARGLERQRGHLGEDVTLKTAHGKAVFATGDRIQFSGNGYGKKAINAGLSNGQVGTIKEIAFEGDFLTPRLTVTLDAAKGDKPQEISFVVGEDGKAGEFNNFKLGYAGTIYRGQGRTLDQAYVCHSSQWRSSAAYVALTRHRESVEIFAARETVADLDAMARGLARPENKRAATAYHIDAAQTIDLEAAIGALELRTASRATAARPPLSRGQAADAGDGGATDRTTSREAGVVPRGVLGAAAKVAGAVFSALLGETPAAPPPMTAKQRHDARIKALLDAEDADRAARQQEIARRLGTSVAMTPEELKREQEAQEKRSRDRGGGQSL
jgi:ATP-dependent exoDNAse (exonuclease V) alpha subunit